MITVRDFIDLMCPLGIDHWHRRQSMGLMHCMNNLGLMAPKQIE